MPTVLAAIDGSEHAARALRAAVGLLADDADYVLVSVVPPWSSATVIDEGLADGERPAVRTHGAATGASPIAPTASGLSDALVDYYRIAQQQAASGAGVERFEHVIEESRPQKRRIGREICESATAHGADVVVVGSHGSSHTGELLLGSVSQYVLHHAPCPVLVVRG